MSASWIYPAQVKGEAPPMSHEVLSSLIHELLRPYGALMALLREALRSDAVLRAQLREMLRMPGETSLPEETRRDA